MKHLYTDDEGEVVAADTVEQAARHYDCELGGNENPRDEWSQIPDEKVIVSHDEETRKDESKTAAEWADEYETPTLVFSTYT